MKRASLYLVAGAPLCLASCVALFDPPPDRIHITSNPPGATVKLFPGGEYTTPCDAVFDRQFDMTNVEISRSGYETERVAVRASGARFLIILDALTIVGIVGDALITGAISPYPDDPIHVDLRASAH